MSLKEELEEKMGKTLVLSRAFDDFTEWSLREESGKSILINVSIEHMINFMKDELEPPGCRG